MTDMGPIDTAALDCCGYPYRCTLQLMEIKTPLKVGVGGWIFWMFFVEHLERNFAALTGNDDSNASAHCQSTFFPTMSF